MERAYQSHTRLGQHFLTRADTAAQIAGAAGLTKDGVVLEIGPGHGILTRELLARAGKVVAIEKDSTLFAELQTTFADEVAEGRLQLLLEDIRSFTWNLELGTSYSLVANIPYYITGAIIRQFLTAKHQPKAVVLLIQKEVAERIVARNGKQSLLSLSVHAYGTPSIAHIVKAGAFNPPPKVDSVVLVVEDISRNNFTSTDHEQRLFTLLKAAFAGKRKQLGSTLKTLVTMEQLAKVGINKTTRPEDVQLSEWLSIAAQ